MPYDWTIDPSHAGLRLDKFLAGPERLRSRGRAAAALERGKVFLNGEEVGPAQAGAALRSGDRVSVWMDRPGSAARRHPGGSRPLRVPGGDLHIVFEDAWLIVIDKPAGLLTVPLPRRSDAPSVYTALVAHLRPRRRTPHVVHRIDRDTSGLVVFAKDPRTQQALKAQFIRREPDRVYLAVVAGVPSPAAGTWRDHLTWDRDSLAQEATDRRDPRGAEAVSTYRVVEAFGRASLIEVRLRTGKRNQIRVQAALRGHPLVGERQYGAGSRQHGVVAFARQALHAARLGFDHPADGRPLGFEAPMPADLAALLDALRRS